MAERHPDTTAGMLATTTQVFEATYHTLRGTNEHGPGAAEINALVFAVQSLQNAHRLVVEAGFPNI